MHPKSHESGSRAIFLSYAREDTVAAEGIALALRAGGIEVWFDRNELRGGDAWDQKIRHEIKTCALFLPVISAHTEARGEGYFRLEWKLADERTHLMAKGVPFLLPVVVDETREDDALVPDNFRAVQWTRLPAGAATPEFVAQARRLLEMPWRTAGSGAPAGPRPAVRRRLPGWTGLAALATIALAAAIFFGRTAAPAPNTTTVPRGPVTKNSAPLTEARKLAEKAKALQDEYAMDDALRDSLTLAEQLCKKAVELDPMDSEAWAIFARVNLSLMNFDSSPTRLDDARAQAQRAMQIEPKSVEARLAMADYYRKQGSSTWPDAEQSLRELAQEHPTDQRVLRLLALILQATNRQAEALAYYQRAAAAPGGDSKALMSGANILFSMERYAEALDAVNQSLALRQTVAALIMKMSFLMWRGDLDGARDTLEKIPVASRFDDKCAYYASVLWLWRREPEQSLAVLRAVPRDFLNNVQTLRGPKAFLAAQAHQMAGRADAAQAEFQAALQLIERRRGGQPNDPMLLSWRALLLACVGEKTEAERAYRLYEQLGAERPTLTPLSAGVAHQPEFIAAEILLQLGRTDDAVGKLEALLQRSTSSSYRATIKFDPFFDPLRNHPRFAALLAEPKEEKTSP